MRLGASFLNICLGLMRQGASYASILFFCGLVYQGCLKTGVPIPKQGRAGLAYAYPLSALRLYIMLTTAVSLANTQLLAAVDAIARQDLQPLAHRIDRGHYPLEIMAKLGQAGAFAAHLQSQGSRFDTAIDAMQIVSRACGATGFLTWAHQVCGLYLDASDNPALRGQVLHDHAYGKTFGGTALSNPMKTWANIEPMLLRAKKVPGGYSVSGALPWVSHIAYGQHCGAVAQVEGGKEHDIMFLLRLDEARVKLAACPEFSGMEGTSTWSIHLKDFFVGSDDIIADPAKPFIARIRAAFVLLQMGIGLGVVQGSIDDMLEVAPVLGHVNQFLEDQTGSLQLALDKAEQQTRLLAQTPFETSKDYLLDVLDLRIQGAKLGLQASQAALLHQGARGYLANANPQRRIREAQFVAIVTPAIKHLRYLVQQIMSEELPA